MPPNAAEQWEKFPDEYLAGFNAFLDSAHAIPDGDDEAIDATVHALRFHRDAEAHTFLRFGYLTGRFENTGSVGNTPPIFISDEIWEAAEKSLADYPTTPHPILMAARMLLFTTTKELFELDGDDPNLDARHGAIARRFAYPAIGRDLRTDPLTDQDTARGHELMQGFLAGKATWTSRRWFERAATIGGELRASAIREVYGKDAHFRNVSPQRGEITGSNTTSTVLMEGDTAHLLLSTTRGRFGRTQRLDEPPAEHLEILAWLGFEQIVLPNGKTVQRARPK